METSDYLTESLRLDEICRTCLSKGEEMKPMFNSNVNEMLFSFTSIQIHEDDGLPNLMCSHCILQCNQAYSFKQLCEKSENTLREYMTLDLQNQLTSNITADTIGSSLPKQERIVNNTEIVEGLLSGLHHSGFSEDTMEILTEDLEEVVEEVIKEIDVGAQEIVEVIPENMKLKYPKCTQAVVFEDDLQGYKREEIDIAIEEVMGEVVKKIGIEVMNLKVKPTASVRKFQEPVRVQPNERGKRKRKLLQEYAKEVKGEVVKEIAILKQDNLEEAEVKPENSESKYSCPNFTKSFEVEDDLKSHTNHEKDPDHICHMCHKEFTDALKLKIHLKIHLDKKPGQHDQCDISLAKTRSGCKNRHAGDLRHKTHLCSECGKSFKYSQSLTKHMRYHTGRNLFSCEFCDKKYVEASSLKSHIASHLGERPERSYICDLCKKGFINLCNLQKHIRVHTGERPFECPICKKRFQQSSYIDIHMRTHTGDRPYVCLTCDKSFVTSSALIVHRRIHTGEKPYACDTCGKSYTQQQTLVMHKRTHIGDKSVCNICDKGFATSDQLSKHMGTHNCKRPHTCNVCGKTYALLESLKAHLRFHLGKNGEPLDIANFMNGEVG